MKRSEKLGTPPRGAYFVVAAVGAIFLAIVFVVGKSYLANGRGDVLFLAVALFLVLLLVASVIRWLTKKR